MQGLSRRDFGVVVGGGLASAVLPACNIKQDTGAAEREVAEFHRQLDAGNFAALYWAGHDDLKAAATEADFVALLEAIHRKLGKVTSSASKGWNVNQHNLTTDIRLVYETQFTEAPGTEQFVYRLEGKKPLLLNYNINSMALITK